MDERDNRKTFDNIADFFYNSDYTIADIIERTSDGKIIVAADIVKKYPLKDYKKSDSWVEEHPGRPTGRITKLVDAPVAWLLKLPGLRGEHKVLRYDMPKIQKLSELVIDSKFECEHPVEIGVQHDGKAYVDDGNHRIRACKIAKKSTYKAKITFYGGGEDEFNLAEVLKKYPSVEESGMTNQEKQIKAMQVLVAKAKIAIETGLNHMEVVAEINKLADADTGGATNFGSTADQEYANETTRGEDTAGENDPNKGDQRRTGPREPNDMVQEASSNKPCKDCGMPTDSCACMKSSQPTTGKNPANTVPGLDPQLDPTKHTAAFDMIVALVKDSSKMTRVASHMEEIEIPFGDLKLEAGIDYHMSGRHQEVNMLVDKYLRINVYHGNRRYSIARIEQSKSKFFVKVLVFDNQIEHEAASNDTKDGRLNKVSSVKSNKLEKTAWKKRLTEVIGNNDDTGLVRCPIEGGFLTRSCGTCPFAGNPHTYIVDGGVLCHFDEGPVWLNNLGVKEHRPLDNSSNG